MKHRMKKIIFFIALVILYAYICALLNIPNRVILMQGETLQMKTLLGISITKNLTQDSQETISASSPIGNSVGKEPGSYQFEVKLFDKIKVKDISVHVLDEMEVVPVGRAIGMKLYTEGVLVVGKSEISGKTSYEEADIEEGDLITKINHEDVTCTEDLIQKVEKSKGEKLLVTYKREDSEKETTLVPIQTEDQRYKIGLWVRDAAAGIGTLSFYEPTSGTSIALGHGIMDIDTQELIQIAKGNIITTKILSIKKGKKGDPGEMKGTIDTGTDVGIVTKNTEFGVIGKITNKSVLGLRDEDKVPVALRSEIQEGKAEILTQLEDGSNQKYEIEIKKIYRNNNENNKSFLIKITDEELLEKTGGIVQGMSGSPILQNGKLIGVVTNVLVNDPTSGYGVFADLMIKKMKEVEG